MLLLGTAPLVGNWRNAGDAPRSTGSWYGFLFPVPAQPEGCRQMQRGVVQGQVMKRRPEVQGLAVGAAVGVGALKDVLAQVGREGALGIVGLAVERAWAAALLAPAAQVGEQAQVLEDLGQRHLLTQERKIHLGRAAGGAAGAGLTGGGGGAT